MDRQKMKEDTKQSAWPFSLLTRISHRFSTAMADKATLTRLFSPFDFDLTRHAVGRKVSNKSRHSNLFHRLAMKTGEISGSSFRVHMACPLVWHISEIGSQEEEMQKNG
ncbi:MAG: hypothetical protein QGG73_01460 [Candidatus Hydrogenedentes bacterium]|jgi:hypothetical protein|nr:hypothetical protein [Candidatus Hydrogenedentota bacterium]